MNINRNSAKKYVSLFQSIFFLSKNAGINIIMSFILELRLVQQISITFYHKRFIFRKKLFRVYKNDHNNNMARDNN